jgi:hypothetical protein
MTWDANRDGTKQSSLRGQWDELQLTRSRIDILLEQAKLTGDLEPAQQALGELKLNTSLYDQLFQEQVAQIRGILGRNFLGVEEWKRGFDVSVGRPPPIPDWITRELLEEDCQLHPGAKVKHTHILLLVPKTLNGDPYSPLTLAKLCEWRSGSGVWLIDTGYKDWRGQAWAAQSPSESEWALIPKSDPDPSKVPNDMHFRGKTIAEQLDVYEKYAKDYREVRAIEVMTAAVLNDVVHGLPRMLDGTNGVEWNYLRCVEPNTYGGRVQVGNFFREGLGISVADMNGPQMWAGFGLARKPRS